MQATAKYHVTAKRWDHGWELHINNVGVTQVRLLAHADRQARDLIETMTGRPVPRDTGVVVEIELGGLERQVEDVRRLVERAENQQRVAAREYRRVVRELRDSGLSVSDTATLMGVSRGRISQLSEAGPAARP